MFYRVFLLLLLQAMDGFPTRKLVLDKWAYETVLTPYYYSETSCAILTLSLFVFICEHQRAHTVIFPQPAVGFIIPNSGFLRVDWSHSFDYKWIKICFITSLTLRRDCACREQKPIFSKVVSINSLDTKWKISVPTIRISLYNKQGCRPSWKV